MLNTIDHGQRSDYQKRLFSQHGDSKNGSILCFGVLNNWSKCVMDELGDRLVLRSPHAIWLFRLFGAIDAIRHQRLVLHFVQIPSQMP